MTSLLGVYGIYRVGTKELVDTAVFIFDDADGYGYYVFQDKAFFNGVDNAVRELYHHDTLYAVTAEGGLYEVRKMEYVRW